jgi:hypothetical protein
VLPPFLVSRCLVLLATFAGSAFLHPVGWRDPIPEAFLQPLFRHDAYWYHRVWEFGYSGPAADHYAAFYPVYPVLVRVFGFLLGNDLASVLISNAAFLAALGLVYGIAVRHLTPTAATLSLWVLALWPWSIFYSYPYAESTELLVVAGAFLLMEREKWVWSSLLAALAGASRPSGILTSLGFAGEFVDRIKRRIAGRSSLDFGRSLMPVVLGGLLGTAGMIAYCLLLLKQSGDPFAFLHAQTFWLGPHPRNPLFPIASTARLFTRHDILDTEAPVFPILLLFLGALVWSLRRLPFRYAAWGIGFIVVTVLHGYYVRSFTAAPRHMVEWFPAYFAVAALLSTPRRRAVLVAWLAVSCALLIAYSAMYGSGYFVS